MWDFAFLFYLIEKLDWALLEFAYKYGSFVFKFYVESLLD